MQKPCPPKTQKVWPRFLPKACPRFFDYGVRENGKHLRTKNRINQRPTPPSAKTKSTKEKCRVGPCTCLSLPKNRDRCLVKTRYHRLDKNRDRVDGKNRGHVFCFFRVHAFGFFRGHSSGPGSGDIDRQDCSWIHLPKLGSFFVHRVFCFFG